MRLVYDIFYNKLGVIIKMRIEVILAIVFGASILMAIPFMVYYNKKNKGKKPFINESLNDFAIVNVYGSKNAVIDGKSLKEYESFKGTYGETTIRLEEGNHEVVGIFEVYGHTMNEAKTFKTKELTLPFAVEKGKEYDVATSKYQEDYITYIPTGIEIIEGTLRSEHFLGLRDAVKQ